METFQAQEKEQLGLCRLHLYLINKDIVFTKQKITKQKGNIQKLEKTLAALMKLQTNADYHMMHGDFEEALEHLYKRNEA